MQQGVLGELGDHSGLGHPGQVDEGEVVDEGAAGEELVEDERHGPDVHRRGDPHGRGLEARGGDLRRGVPHGAARHALGALGEHIVEVHQLPLAREAEEVLHLEVGVHQPAVVQREHALKEPLRVSAHLDPFARPRAEVRELGAGGGSVVVGVGRLHHQHVLLPALARLVIQRVEDLGRHLGADDAEH